MLLDKQTIWLYVIGMERPRDNQTIINHLFTKIRWGATKSDLETWLNEAFSIQGDEADSILSDAFKQWGARLRQKAVLRILASAICASIALAYFLLPILTNISLGGIKMFLVSALMIALGCISITIFFRSILLLISSKEYS